MAHRIAVIAGDGIGKEVDARRPARARRGGAQVRPRACLRSLRLELRQLRQARLVDAARLEGQDRRPRLHFLRCRAAGRPRCPITSRCGIR